MGEKLRNRQDWKPLFDALQSETDNHSVWHPQAILDGHPSCHARRSNAVFEAVAIAVEFLISTRNYTFDNKEEISEESLGQLIRDLREIIPKSFQTESFKDRWLGIRPSRWTPLLRQMREKGVLNLPSFIYWNKGRQPSVFFPASHNSFIIGPAGSEQIDHVPDADLFSIFTNPNWKTYFGLTDGCETNPTMSSPKLTARNTTEGTAGGNNKVSKD